MYQHRYFNVLRYIFIIMVIVLQIHGFKVDFSLNKSMKVSQATNVSSDIIASINKFERNTTKMTKSTLLYMKKIKSDDNRSNASAQSLSQIDKAQHADMQLLNDNQLKDKEIHENPEVKPIDIVLRYSNGMFGLVDSDATLHVWRAPFVSLGEIWPHPKSITSSFNVFTICITRDSLSFKVIGVNNYIIENAINRYKRILCGKQVSFYPSNWRHQERLLDNAIFGQKIFRTTAENFNRYFDRSHFSTAVLKGELRFVEIQVESRGHQWPSLYMNESYRLSIGGRGIFIHAKETWGVLRALESLSQLAWRTKAGRMFINETRITDMPRFKHRGVMLDTARHFMPKDVILRNIDAMAMNKFNVFHWHIVDDQSFPLVTNNHPEFAEFGSYDFGTKVYRPDDVREILEYARLRGIRVIPEIDSPSHTLSWRKSHPEVMTRCLDQFGRWSGQYGPLNMAAASTYRLLASLFEDIVRMFPDKWVHIGSDEVPSGCVTSNTAIKRWMQFNGVYSVELLTDLYTRKLQNIVTEIGRNHSQLQRGFIVWQEAFDRNSALKKGTIVQLWKSSSTSEAAMVANQRVYVIYSSCWYLDRLEYGAQWAAHYQCDPADDQGTMTSSNVNWSDYILGGEAAMWTEFFDADNVLQRIWPLASAAAERLWSPRTLRNENEAAPRLEEMRCRMLARGIPVGVASGAGDCGQSIEVSGANLASQDFSSHKSALFLSDTSSLSLLLQIFINVFSSWYLRILLVIALLIYVYVYRPIQWSRSRAMLIVITFYTVLWIISQQILLIRR